MLFGLFSRRPVVSVIRLSGAIGVSSPLKPGLTLAALASTIERAFETPRAKAVAIQINSPGGSPAQSMMIYKRIRALAEEKELPVYVFTEDVAASGGYMLAVAGDEIYADPSSIIGSIGVVSASFGFTKLIENYGIERRVYTAGTKKATLDPFQPENPEDIERLKLIQKDIHKTFIDLVKGRRGVKIEGKDEELFTGEFWSGNQALKLGLIDGIDDLRSKMREIYGKKVKLKKVEQKTGMFSRMRGLTKMGLGNETSFAEEMLSAVETRALWSRYGF